MTTVVHFAYGIEMHPEEMARIVPSARLVGRAVLADHRLEFYGHSRVWDGAEESVVPEPGSVVHGVLYRMSPRDADRLDAERDVKLNGTGSRFHYPVEVLAEDGAIQPALMLKKDRRGAPRPPSSEYLARVVQGAELCGLPQPWVEALRGTVSVPAAYPVPQRIATLAVIGIGCDC